MIADTASPEPPRLTDVVMLAAVWTAAIGAALAAILYASGCRSLGAVEPVVVHVIDTADEVCPAVVLFLPEVGRVCTLLHQAERIVRVLSEAKAAGQAATLDVAGRRVVIPASDVGAVLAAVAEPVAAAKAGAK